LGGHQLLVGAALDDPALPENEDRVGMSTVDRR
jgi:hypothetical protein